MTSNKVTTTSDSVVIPRRRRGIYAIAFVFAFTLIAACSNTSLQETVRDINMSYRYESQAKAVFADLDKDTDEWNKNVSELTKLQESITNEQAAKRAVSDTELNEAQEILDKMRGIREREDERLAVVGGYIDPIEEARSESTDKIHRLKKNLDSDWSGEFIDVSIEINKQKSVYFRTMYDLYTEIWKGSHLQIDVANAKMRLQTKANGADVDTYNAAVMEWNNFTNEINPKIEANEREVRRLKDAVAQLDDGIESLQNNRSAIARDNSVRALVERDMELADLK